ncbi:hypothetical protein JHK85_053500 [Glycine max]|uniref:Uncharacterized protein n=1 Tax=Glycine soja TaxID=3848 RepID=A0A0B2Q8L3_GLYSO|nr:hypothetical protein JHK87_052731 [Glycine soja]KAG4927014.1 hypothetical protein JHK85_053500 [Glycine max]KHN16264.1 hypothetical protein glysoja_048926 [Glycine soja]
MQAQIELIGTMFRVVPHSVPMLKSINLANDGFLYRRSTAQGSLSQIRHLRVVH